MVPELKEHSKFKELLSSQKIDETKITEDTEDIVKYQNARDKHRILQVLERKNPKVWVAERHQTSQP